MADRKIKDGDYVLSEGRAWFSVPVKGKTGFAVRIAETDEGIVVDIYENNREAEASVASCYAFSAELEAK